VTAQEFPRPTLLTTLATFRVLGIPLASIIDAVPEALLTAAFVRGILWPAAMGAQYLQWLGLLMMVEFLVVHSSAFVGGALVVGGARGPRLGWVLGFSVFYFLFGAGLALGFHSWFPVVALAVLTVNRVLYILMHDTATQPPLTLIDTKNEWLFGVAAYVLSMLIGVLVVQQWGQLLWEPQVRQYFTLQGQMSGQHDVPIIAGVCYFAARTVRALCFSRAVGTPGYQHNTASATRVRVLGIHVGLWYIFLRALGAYLFQMGFLAVLVFLSGRQGIFVAFGALFFLIFTGVLLYTYVRLCLVSPLLAGPGRAVTVQVLDEENATRNVKRIKVSALGDSAFPERELTVEAVRRRNFLPPGETTIAGERFTSPAPKSASVIRIGRTYLCTTSPYVSTVTD
jgi:hypothetical protein